MCGIVGLFLKDKTLKPNLGSMLTRMLVTMTDRGPDSAGVAIYGQAKPGEAKLTLQSETPAKDFESLTASLKKLLKINSTLTIKDTHAIVQLKECDVHIAAEAIRQLNPNIHIMSKGELIEIYKEVGPPQSVVNRFQLQDMGGSHGIGHTRMATESAVTTMGSHPFNTGLDQCLVHNGSLSNHNFLRRQLRQNGLSFETENDSEVAAAYLTWKMNNGESLDSALNSAIADLDGFYTFLVGTKDGFGVVRDPVACKPAVMAETKQYVAFGSEYRALVNLPNIESAHVWEPEPATVYFWKH